MEAHPPPRPAEPIRRRPPSSAVEAHRRSPRQPAAESLAAGVAPASLRESTSKRSGSPAWPDRSCRLGGRRKRTHRATGRRSAGGIRCLPTQASGIERRSTVRSLARLQFEHRRLAGRHRQKGRESAVWRDANPMAVDAKLRGAGAHTPPHRDRVHYRHRHGRGVTNLESEWTVGAGIGILVSGTSDTHHGDDPRKWSEERGARKPAHPVVVRIRCGRRRIAGCRHRPRSLLDLARSPEDDRLAGRGYPVRHGVHEQRAREGTPPQPAGAGFPLNPCPSRGLRGRRSGKRQILPTRDDRLDHAKGDAGADHPGRPVPRAAAVSASNLPATCSSLRIEPRDESYASTSWPTRSRTRCPSSVNWNSTSMSSSGGRVSGGSPRQRASVRSPACRTHPD